MKLAPAIAVIFALGAAGALAQTADSPVMGSSADQEQDTGGEVQQAAEVLVLGDAIGGGLGAGLLRLGEASGRYDVTIRFNEESGLARPEVYDWASTVAKLLETSSFDIIVVMMGANDRQMIRSGNERYAFNSPGWIEAYKRQTDLLLDQLAESGAKVYWVAMPPMADPDYDKAMQSISALQRERAEARGIPFLDLRAELSASDGSYTDSGPDDTGVTRKLRGRDGISFFKAGNNRMGQLVLQAIESGAAFPLQKTAKAPQAEQPAAGPVVEPSAIPMFGQMTMAGDALTVSPQGVSASASVVAGSGLGPAEALKTIRAMAPAGSDAERLFRLGDGGRAPKGRPDDFTLPPQQSD